MAKNRARYPGVPRGGAALLSGLVSCGVCGRKMVTGYNDDGREARYSCSWEATTYGGRHCQSISARPVDARVSALVLEAISPSAIEVSLQVAEDIELERQQIHDGWKQRLERADYEIALARRRYEAVDPDNRLVARTLEKDWEAALARGQTLADDHQRTLSQQPERLTEEDKKIIRCLAEDVPSLWKATSTTARDRQTIVRIMLDRVVIQVFGE
ncbi:zinc ribbon domain-containing protein, partial [Rhizobium favelukesii]|nr:zinc ribbon domain-containing protein [Rhizobium favelukesii]